ncbi:hypothetical protein EV702DRAFT_1049226 [Suillus placidus]|uniref:Uncharacterized protein n=1 Tax=Suillus placidus TaxID=48579 RepID=A0A9P7CY59_9AGAM|nr:hypothetical protein EV702DRAFT_1049226 [Suillus placidus]
MDYALCEAAQHNMEGITRAITFYDINCIGWIDGEIMETLWAHLNLISPAAQGMSYLLVHESNQFWRSQREYEFDYWLGANFRMSRESNILDNLDDDPADFAKTFDTWTNSPKLTVISLPSNLRVLKIQAWSQVTLVQQAVSLHASIYTKMRKQMMHLELGQDQLQKYKPLLYQRNKSLAWFWSVEVDLGVPITRGMRNQPNGVTGCGNHWRNTFWVMHATWEGNPKCIHYWHRMPRQHFKTCRGDIEDQGLILLEQVDETSIPSLLALKWIRECLQTLIEEQQQGIQEKMAEIEMYTTILRRLKRDRGE